jgi:hypothetical protein
MKPRWSSGLEELQLFYYVSYNIIKVLSVFGLVRNAKN